MRFLDRTTETPDTSVRGLTRSRPALMEVVDLQTIFADAVPGNPLLDREEQDRDSQIISVRGVEGITPQDYTRGGGGGGGVSPHDHSGYLTPSQGDSRYYRHGVFIEDSAGLDHAGLPVVLNDDGELDVSFMPLTVAGDLLVGDGIQADRLSVGADETILVVDATQDLGMSWVTPAVLAATLDHGLFLGLTDEADHPYALLIDGTRALTGPWAANNDITGLTLLDTADLTSGGGYIHTNDLVMDDIYTRGPEDNPGNYQAGSIYYYSVIGITAGGAIDLLGGDAAAASNSNGGVVYIAGGIGDGAGSDGTLEFTSTQSTNKWSKYDTSLLSASRTHKLPNVDGNLAVTASTDGMINLVEDTSPELSADLDFNEFKAIAMVCDNGATLPGGPTNGQWFLHTPTGRTILYIYCDAVWCPITSFGSMTVYVDKTDGTDSQDKGGAVDAGAFATIQFAVDQIPGLVGSNVVININNETYAESVTVQGKAFTGNYNILFEGQFSEQLSEALVQSGSKGSSTVQAYLNVSAPGWGVNAFQYMWVKFEDDTLTAALQGKEYLIDSNTSSRITFLNMLPSSPVSGDTFTVQDQDTEWGMTVSGTEPILRVEVAQTNVDCHRIYFLEMTEVPTLWMIDYLANSSGRWDACKIREDTRLLNILVRGGLLWLQDCFVDGARSSGTRSITLEDGGALTLNHTLVRCLNNTTSGNRGVYAHSNSTLNVTGSMITRAYHGLFIDLGGTARYSGNGNNDGRFRINNCNTALFATEGGLIAITSVIFSANSTNENPAGASDPAWII